jgi:hypothetical protein
MTARTLEGAPRKSLHYQMDNSLPDLCLTPCPPRRNHYHLARLLWAHMPRQLVHQAVSLQTPNCLPRRTPALCMASPFPTPARRRVDSPCTNQFVSPSHLPRRILPSWCHHRAFSRSLLSPAPLRRRKTKRSHRVLQARMTPSRHPLLLLARRPRPSPNAHRMTLPRQIQDRNIRPPH